MSDYIDSMDDLERFLGEDVGRGFSSEVSTEASNNAGLLASTPATSASAVSSFGLKENLREMEARSRDGQLERFMLREDTGSTGTDTLQSSQNEQICPPAYEKVTHEDRDMILEDNFSSKNEEEELPRYSPSVYKIGVVRRKVEWLTPYEPSCIRAWKNVIMELNSTQLNFYEIPSILEGQVLALNFLGMNDPEFLKPLIDEEVNRELILSPLTTPFDTNFHVICSKLGIILQSAKQRDLAKSDGRRQGLEFSKSRKLLRSYSLQHACIGLASDYQKKRNVLRLRVETEQILIQCPDIKSLIDWHNAISAAKSVSLDISSRELPKERTLPRRRRRRNERNRRNNRLVPDKQRSQKSSTEMEKLTLKFMNMKVKVGSMFRGKINANNLCRYTFSERWRLPVGQGSVAFWENNGSSQSYGSHARAIDGEGSGQHSVTARHRRTASYSQDNRDDEEEDIQNISDLRSLDDSDEENEDFEREISEHRGERNRSSTCMTSITASSMDYKWRPRQAEENEKKNYRTCLKCIRLLSTEDTWICKSLVKPDISRNPDTQGSMSPLGSTMSKKSYKRKMTFDAYSKDSDEILSRIPNHSLREYMVGSHGLIPKHI